MEFSCLPIANNLLKNCRVLNQREDIIELLDNDNIIAEIGVEDGNFSQKLLTKSKKLYLVDDYNSNDCQSLNRFTSSNHYDYVVNHFKDNTNVEIKKGDSYEILNQFDDLYFDIIYIDGGSLSNYYFLRKRLCLAYSKLKVGGYLWINDYTNNDPILNFPYGVQKAVNELINIYGLEAVYLTLNNSNFHDICLRKLNFSIADQILENRLSLCMNDFGYFFLLKNEEFISKPMKNGIHWETDLLKIILPYLDKSHSVIDIGAHVGCHTIPYAQRVGMVYSFEPQRTIYQILLKNCQINQINNFKAYQFAIGHLDYFQVSMNSHCQDGTSEDDEVSYDTDQLMNYGGIQLGVGLEQVSMMTLDSFNFETKIRYIKVDAGGSEPLIFYGARKLIERDLPIILFSNREQTKITEEMKTIMTIPPVVEHFSVIDFCVQTLEYQQPIMLSDDSILLIPKG